MYSQLAQITHKPHPFSVYTASDLWTDPHRARKMLAFHLDETLDISSRNHRFIDASASWITDHFSLSPGKAVCDFGCGPGLYTSRLARSGAEVTGLDFSKASIAYAREQATQAGHHVTYIHTDYLMFREQNAFDLVTMIMCDFCALGPDQRSRLLDIMYTSLKPGGALLLDVYSMAAFTERTVSSTIEKNQLDHFWYAEDYYAIVNTFTYEAEAVSLDKYSLFPETAAPETVYNWLQYFSPETLIAELAAAGFSPGTPYKDVAGTRYDPTHSEFAITARKPQ